MATLRFGFGAALPPVATIPRMTTPSAPVYVVEAPLTPGWLLAYTTPTGTIQHLYPPTGATVPDPDGPRDWDTRPEAEAALLQLVTEPTPGTEPEPSSTQPDTTEPDPG